MCDGWIGWQRSLHNDAAGNMKKKECDGDDREHHILTWRGYLKRRFGE
jgi:hypothetical protein